jgi:3'(2'), 5'-bisphosphate nucleotidase
VTAADRSASEYIVSNLKRAFPAHAVLSEEAVDDLIRLERSHVWMVDPMGGTREFIEHRDEFSVMIGLAVDGVPTVGAVYQPTKKKLYYAASGMGAFLEVEGAVTPLHVSSESSTAKMILAVSRSHRSSRVDSISERLQIKDSITSGSVGLKVGLICEARAHLYLHTGGRTHLWDTCGPDAILREAGGQMTDLSGAPLSYRGQGHENLNGIVASNGVVHDHIVKTAQEVLAGFKT